MFPGVLAAGLKVLFVICKLEVFSFQHSLPYQYSNIYFEYKDDLCYVTRNRVVPMGNFTCALTVEIFSQRHE